MKHMSKRKNDCKKLSLEPWDDLMFVSYRNTRVYLSNSSKLAHLYVSNKKIKIKFITIVRGLPQIIYTHKVGGGVNFIYINKKNTHKIFKFFFSKYILISPELSESELGSQIIICTLHWTWTHECPKIVDYFRRPWSVCPNRNRPAPTKSRMIGCNDGSTSFVLVPLVQMLWIIICSKNEHGLYASVLSIWNCDCDYDWLDYIYGRGSMLWIWNKIQKNNN